MSTRMSTRGGFGRCFPAALHSAWVLASIRPWNCHWETLGIREFRGDCWIVMIPLGSSVVPCKVPSQGIENAYEFRWFHMFPGSKFYCPEAMKPPSDAMRELGRGDPPPAFAARHDPAGGCGRLRIGHSVRWQHRARPARSYLRGLTRYCSGISYENLGVVAEGEAITRSTFIESLN